MSSEETVFKNLSHRGSVILGFEVANHVLSNLAGAIVKEGNVGSSQSVPFSAKGNLIQYLCGYVFGTVYRRIRRPNNAKTMLGNQSLSILLAGKSALESSLSGKSMLEKKTDVVNRIKFLKILLI